MQESKIKDILRYTESKNAKGSKPFLGIIRYYQPFVRNFAMAACPLTGISRRKRNKEPSQILNLFLFVPLS